jgi:hypothetical protein
LEDFLWAAVRDRDLQVRLVLDHTNVGETYISVLVEGIHEAILVATIIRGEN